MYQVCICNKKTGEEKIIESENVVLLFGNPHDPSILVYEKENKPDDPRMADMVTSAAISYVQATDRRKSKVERLISIGIFKMINDVKLRSIYDEDIEQLKRLRMEKGGHF